MEMMEMHHNTNNRIFVIHELSRFSEHDNRTLSLRKNQSFIYLLKDKKSNKSCPSNRLSIFSKTSFVNTFISLHRLYAYMI